MRIAVVWLLDILADANCTPTSGVFSNTTRPSTTEQVFHRVPAAIGPLKHFKPAKTSYNGHLHFDTYGFFFYGLVMHCVYAFICVLANDLNIVKERGR